MGTHALDVTVRSALLEAEIATLKDTLAARERRIQLLEEALRYLKSERYGASREQLGAAPGQRGLFNEVEVLAELAEVTGVEPPLTATPPMPRPRVLHPYHAGCSKAVEFRQAGL